MDEAGRAATFAAFREELSLRARLSFCILGPVGLVAYVGWAVFDHVLEPAHAQEFLIARLLGGLVIAPLAYLLLSGRARGRWAEWSGLAMMITIQVGIAYMLPRADRSLPAYLLGFSLAIYSTALIGDWHWPFSVTVVVASALAVADATAPIHMTVPNLVTCAFYLSAASIIALIGQALRYRSSLAEFLARRDAETARSEAEAARAEAERQRGHNLVLVARLDELSRRDPLTGIANRRVFDQVLDAEITRARRSGGTVGLILIDIDHFKQLNDTHGHQVGDQVLRSVAVALASEVRSSDLAARYGGEEFGVVVPGLGRHELAGLAQAMRARIRSGTNPRTTTCPAQVTVSAGAALFPAHADTADGLLGEADRALYIAKTQGRDRVCVASLAGAE